MMTEMSKLILTLWNLNIPAEVVVDVAGNHHIRYPEATSWICDVVSNKFTYGGSKGLLEIMGLVDEEAVGDSVEGWLTANEVASRIASHYFGINITVED